MLRSTWNYHLHPERFAAWLRRVDAVVGGRIANPVATVLWNMNKRYLLEMRDKGVAIPKSVIVPPTDAVAELARFARDSGVTRVVVKPTVSANATDTFIVADAAAPTEDERRRVEALPYSEVLVQEFMPQVQSTGELSLVFLNGRHAWSAIKRPADGDFRVSGQPGVCLRGCG